MSNAAGAKATREEEIAFLAMEQMLVNPLDRTVFGLTWVSPSASR
jgi:hypothetical protein